MRVHTSDSICKWWLHLVAVVMITNSLRTSRVTATGTTVATVTDTVTAIYTATSSETVAATVT